MLLWNFVWQFHFPTSLFPAIDFTYVEDRNSEHANEALLDHEWTLGQGENGSNKKKFDTLKVSVDDCWERLGIILL